MKSYTISYHTVNARVQKLTFLSLTRNMKYFPLKYIFFILDLRNKKKELIPFPSLKRKNKQKKTYQ